MATGNRGTIQPAHYKVILYNYITAGALIFTVDNLVLFFANVLLSVVCEPMGRVQSVGSAFVHLHSAQLNCSTIF